MTTEHLLEAIRVTAYNYGRNPEASLIVEVLRGIVARAQRYEAQEPLLKPITPMHTEHELKCWPEYFFLVQSGVKTFEVRRNDRAFKAGDVLFLREWVPDHDTYTGKEIRVRVTYVLEGENVEKFLQPGFCVMAIQKG